MDDGESPIPSTGANHVQEEEDEQEEEEEMPLVIDESTTATAATAASVPSRRKPRRKAIVFFSASSATLCCLFSVLFLVIGSLLLYGTVLNQGRTMGNKTICRDEFTNGQGWKAWKYAQGDLAKAEWCFKTDMSTVTSQTAAAGAAGAGAFGAGEEKTPKCHCNNPLLPIPQFEEAWEVTLERNKQLVQESIQSDRPLDMVIIGDSIVEQWLGTQKAQRIPVLDKQNQIYKRLFRDENSFIHGLALGIAGDTATNVLYRLEDGGEMPNEFNPSLWWILVGTNDLFKHNCNVNATLTAIISVVEYIRHYKKDATIVIHSILPRGNLPLHSKQNMVWKSILELNHDLKCYSSSSSSSHQEQEQNQQQQQVQFFNATNLFLTHDKLYINQTLMMPDHIHPNELVFVSWLEHIVIQSMEYLHMSNIPDIQDFVGK